MKYRVTNNIENTVFPIFNNDAELIHFTRKIAVENEDEDLSIIHIGEAKDYLMNYCHNLDLEFIPTDDTRTQIRAYVINVDSDKNKCSSDYTDKEFMDYAEAQEGNQYGEGVYTLKTYESCMNDDCINISETYIRFIYVVVNE